MLIFPLDEMGCKMQAIAIFCNHQQRCCFCSTKACKSFGNLKIGLFDNFGTLSSEQFQSGNSIGFMVIFVVSSALEAAKVVHLLHN